jgi:hypothetical protein
MVSGTEYQRQARREDVSVLNEDLEHFAVFAAQGLYDAGGDRDRIGNYIQ